MKGSNVGSREAEMTGGDKPMAAIVDFGLGNLFSIQRACEVAGLQPRITSSAVDLMAADAVFLPGVGAFGDAMASLRSLDLVSPLREIAQSGKPLIGICLGMQLMMSESEEFGQHEGLGFVPGRVVRLRARKAGGSQLKVPLIGWKRIHKVGDRPDPWNGTPLEGVPSGVHMYFVHSFHALPEDSSVILSQTSYGDATFCSALKRDTLLAFQFHPERSGLLGLELYRNVARWLKRGPEKLD